MAANRHVGAKKVAQTGYRRQSQNTKDLALRRRRLANAEHTRSRVQTGGLVSSTPIQRMDAKLDSKEFQEAIRLAGQAPCICKGESKSLILAAKKGCLKCSAKFIREVGKKDKYNYTALMQSAWYGRIEVVRLLIPLEAKMQKNDGYTALMSSAEGGHPEIVKLLISLEAKMQKNDGKTALMWAAENNQLEAAKLLIAQEAKMQDDLGWTALIWAIKNNKLELVKLLLPIEGHIPDKNGKTSADYAKKAKREIQTLFTTPQQSASVEPPKPACKCGERAKTLLEAADEDCKDCATKFIKEASETVAGTTALIRAAEKGHVEIVKLLIQKEAKMRDSSGQAAIHKAAAGGHVNVVKMLMGFEVEAQDTQGRTALIHAVKAGHAQVAKVIIKQERDIPDNNGKKAGDFASSVHSPELWALFPHDIDDDFIALLELAHESECTCPLEAHDLRSAAMIGCAKCAVRHLFEAGTFTSNKTALMVAAIGDHREIVELLAFKEAGLRSPDGKTAAMHAAEARSPGAVEILIPHEAGLQDEKGKTALVHAIQSGCAEAVKLLLPHEEKIADKNKARPADHAMAVNNLKIWKLFPSDIGPEFAAQLARAHKARCACGERSRNLMQAAVLGCQRCSVRFILQTGGRIWGHTALMLAAAKGYSAVAQLLVHREGRLADNDGWTALMHAAMHGKADVVSVLAPLEAGARDAKGAAAIHHAAFFGRLEAVEALVGSEAGAKTGAGETALMVAAARGHLGVVRLLSQYEAKTQDADGATALMWAAYHGHTQAAEALVPLEANMETWRGFAAVDFARAGKRAELVRVLGQVEAVE